MGYYLVEYYKAKISLRLSLLVYYVYANIFQRFILNNRLKTMYLMRFQS